MGLQPKAEEFGIFLGTMILFTSVASSLFLCIGALSPNQTIATILSPVITVLMFLFGGFYVNTV